MVLSPVRAMTRQVQEHDVNDGPSSFLLVAKAEEDVEATTVTSSTSCSVEAFVVGDHHNSKNNTDNDNDEADDDDDDECEDDDDDDDSSTSISNDSEEEEDSVEETLALLQILSYFCLESFSRLSFYLPVFMQFVWGIAVYILRSLVLTYAVKLFLCQRNKTKANGSNNNNVVMKNSSSSSNKTMMSHHNNIASNSSSSSHCHDDHSLPRLIKDSNFYNTVTSWLTSHAIVPIMLLLPQWFTDPTGGGHYQHYGGNNMLPSGITTSKVSAAVANNNNDAWPPPALICLALLTVFALIVHPDGMTWILLRKLRDGMISLFQSSTTCWAWIVNDYGAILSTIFALATFASLFFFCYLLHRTLARPRKQPLVPNSQHSSLDKTKRRKKKGLRGGGRGGRTRSQQQQQQQQQQQPKGHGTSAPCLEHGVVSESSTVEAEEENRKVASASSSIPTNRAVLPALLEDAAVEASPEESMKNECTSSDHDKQNNSNHDAPTKPSVFDSTHPSSSELPRLRMESVSTIDTSATTTSLCSGCLSESSEQQPCTCLDGSSTPGDRATTPVNSSSSASVRKSNNSCSASRKQTNRRGAKKQSNPLGDGKQHNATTPPVTPSRWDALKPATAISTKRTNHRHIANSHTGAKGRQQYDTAPNLPARHNSSNAGPYDGPDSTASRDSPVFSSNPNPVESLPPAPLSNRKSTADAMSELQRILPTSSLSFDSATASDIGLLRGPRTSNGNSNTQFNLSVPEGSPSFLVSGLPLASFPATASSFQSSTFFSTPPKSKSATDFFNNNNVTTTPPRQSGLNSMDVTGKTSKNAADTTTTTTLRPPPGLTRAAPPGFAPSENQSFSPYHHTPIMANSSLSGALATDTAAVNPLPAHSSSMFFQETQQQPLYDLFSGGVGNNYSSPYRQGDNNNSSTLGDLLTHPAIAYGDSSNGSNSSFMDSSLATASSTTTCGRSSPSFRPSPCSGRVKENPFEVDGMLLGNNGSNNNSTDEDQQIEAELQELGGQMIGSILDF